MTEEVVSVDISVDNFPGSLIKLAGFQSYDDTGQIHVYQIGRWRFEVYGRRNCGAYQTATGKPVESNYFGFSLQLGKGSPYGELFPFPVEKIEDIVEQYSEFDRVFESWPRKSNPGQVTLDDGTVQYFYVVEGPE